MSTFTIQYLANDRALITGYDDEGEHHKAIYSSAEYTHLQEHGLYGEAEEVYNNMVAEFYAPITEAVAALDEQKEAIAAAKMDPALYVVVQEEVEGVEEKRQILQRLEHGTVIIRLIENDEVHRLIWVNDSIELLAA